MLSSPLKANWFYMKKQFAYFFLLLVGISPLGSLFGQDADIPFNSPLYHYIDRIDIKGWADTTVHTDYKPYSFGYAAEIMGRVDTAVLTPVERKWMHLNRRMWDDAYCDETQTKGLFKVFWRNHRDFIHYRHKRLQVYINPVAYLTAGGEYSNYGDSVSREFGLNFRNTRGAQIRGSLFNKVGFFTEVTENQARYPQYIINTYNKDRVLFGEGFMKFVDSRRVFDYFNAKGYITYSPVKELRIKLGKDRAFLGNGYQSLTLSDNAADYFFLNLALRVWKLEYIAHYTRMTDFIKNKPDLTGVHPAKYAVFHQLNIKPWEWLSVGFSEAVVYSPILPGGRRGFEIEYLNPIIFYRSVEQSLGSPDNSFLGFNLKANFLKRFQIYGQLQIDDFNFRKRTEGKAYFGNKYGIQAGLKYVDAFFIKRLDLQIEYNRIRPYMYQHFNPSANFTNYSQSLGHTNGANLHDINLIVRYQPFPRWHGMMSFTYLQQGLDTGGRNFGADPLVSNTTRASEFDNFLLQGDKQSFINLYGKVSYQIWKLNAFADIEGRFRKNGNLSTMMVWGSIRWNIPTKPLKL